MAMLLVDGFQFVPDPNSRLHEDSGLILWRCQKSQCHARFFTNTMREMLDQHPDNNLVHNHLLSRTKMVKTLVFEEIGKFLERRSYAVSDELIREHALKYLDQAFGTTLNMNEMRAVKSAIIKFSHITKAQLKRASGATPEEADRKKKRKKDDMFQWSESLVWIKDGDGYWELHVCDSEGDGQVDDSQDEEKENEIEDILNISEDSSDSPDILTIEENIKADEFDPQMAPMTMKADDYDQRLKSTTYPVSYDAVVSSSSFHLHQPNVLLQHHQLLEPQRYVYQPAPVVLLQPQGDAVVSSATTTVLYPHQSASSGGGLVQVTPSVVQPQQVEDEDEKFFSNLLPMFKALSSKDKVMLKAQFQQLVQWKLKNVV